MRKVKFNYENKLRQKQLFLTTFLPFLLKHTHPAGRALSSYWFVNSFKMVVSEKNNSKSEFSVQSTTKVFSHRQPLYNDLRTSQNWLLFLQDDIKQEYIPVGWVPSAAVTVIGVCLQRRGVCIKVGCLLGGAFCLPGGCTAPIDWMTDVCENIACMDSSNKNVWSSSQKATLTFAVFTYEQICQYLCVHLIDK